MGSSCATDAMKELLTLVKAEAFLTTTSEEGVWATICTPDRYSEGVTTLAWLATSSFYIYICRIGKIFFFRALCRHAPEEVPRVVNFLTPVLSNLYEPQRVVTAAFFAEVNVGRTLARLSLKRVRVVRTVDSSAVLGRYESRGIVDE